MPWTPSFSVAPACRSATKSSTPPCATPWTTWPRRSPAKGTAMQINPSEISELIKSKIQNLQVAAEKRTEGTVISVTDGICRVHGLADVMQGEMLEFP